MHGHSIQPRTQVGLNGLKTGCFGVRCDMAVSLTHFTLCMYVDTSRRCIFMRRAKVNHPAYQEIIALGTDVAPCLLRAITGAQPVGCEDRGKFDQRAQAWLRWAIERGYRW